MVEDLSSVGKNGFNSDALDSAASAMGNGESDILQALTNTPESCGVFLSAVTDCLLPSICRLISHTDGDVRVVISSVLRRMLPNTLRGTHNYDYLNLL